MSGMIWSTQDSSLRHDQLDIISRSLEWSDSFEMAFLTFHGTHSTHEILDSKLGKIHMSFIYNLQGRLWKNISYPTYFKSKQGTLFQKAKEKRIERKNKPCWTQMPGPLGMQIYSNYLKAKDWPWIYYGNATRFATCDPPQSNTGSTRHENGHNMTISLCKHE